MTSLRYSFISLIRLAFLFILIALAAIQALAKESHFKPAIDDVLSSAVGPEKVVVSEDSRLMVYSHAGDLLPNFPVSIGTEVIVSSPVLSDLIGDPMKEIVVITRNAAGQHTLSIFNGDGTLRGSAALPQGETTHYDPVARVRPGLTQDEILVATVSGKIIRFRYDTAGAVEQTQVADVARPASVSAEPRQGGDVFISFPQLAELRVYTVDTVNPANPWTLSRTLTISSPITHPVVFGTSGIYGVNAAGALVGVSTSTGALLSGFPVTLPTLPVDGPLIAEMNSGNAGMELVVPLANGKQAVVSFAGASLPPSGAKPQFATTGVAVEHSGSGVLSGVKNWGSRLTRPLGNTAVSLFGRIRYAFNQTAGNLHLVNSFLRQEVQSGGTFDLGSVPALTDTNRVGVLYNDGAEDVLLTGIPALTLSGADAGDFQITEQPRALVRAGDAKRNVFRLRFHPSSEGPKTATLALTNTSSGQSPYNVTLSGIGRSSFNDLTFDQPTLVADGVSVQAARLTINTINRANITKVQIILNRQLPGELVNIQRGYGQWEPPTGFTELGGANFGSDRIRILPENTQTPSAGSEIIPGSGTVTFVFRFVIENNYGEMPTNTVSYFWQESANNYTYQWEASPRTFAVTNPTGYTPSSFVSLTVAKPTLQAYGGDLQTGSIVIRTSQSNPADDVMLIVNRSPNGLQAQNQRGFFHYTAARGFFEDGSAPYFHNDFVALQPPNTGDRTLGSDVDTSVPGQITLHFRWTALPAYGNVADNDISYWFKESSTGFSIPWGIADTSFAVVPPTGYTPSSLISLTVDTPNFTANNSARQTASAVIRTSQGNPVDDVMVIVNRSPNGLQAQNQRGFFHYTAARGFFEDGSALYYGNNLVALRPRNIGDPFSGSDIDTSVPGQITLHFRWTADPAYGTVPDNDISIWFKESSTGYSVPWQTIQTNFAVSP